MPATAMDFDLTDTMPPELKLAVMVSIFAVERPAMGAMMTPMPTAVVGNHVPFAVSSTASRMIAAALFSKTHGTET